jgi:hypothetical protein
LQIGKWLLLAPPTDAADEEDSHDDHASHCPCAKKAFLSHSASSISSPLGRVSEVTPPPAQAAVLIRLAADADFGSLPQSEPLYLTHCALVL